MGSPLLLLPPSPRSLYSAKPIYTYIVRTLDWNSSSRISAMMDDHKNIGEGICKQFCNRAFNITAYINEHILGGWWMCELPHS